ncbi:MAG: hypothetical protein WAO75_05460 [Atribacterales bacterium]
MKKKVTFPLQKRIVPLLELLYKEQYTAETIRFLTFVMNDEENPGYPSLILRGNQK